MRIGTWNVEKSPASKLDRLRAEVAAASAHLWVFTEPSQERLLAGNDGYPARDTDAPWIRIESSLPLTQLDGAPDQLCVANSVTFNGCELIVVGSVLPWNSAGSRKVGVPDWWRHEVTGTKLFVAVLEEHAQYVRTLKRDHSDAVVIWAGDFNMSVDGPVTVGSFEGRDRFLATLDSLSMDAWNGSCDHLNPVLRTIDLICGPIGAGKSVRQFGRSDLSDHAGYVVDVDLPGLGRAQTTSTR